MGEVAPTELHPLLAVAASVLLLNLAPASARADEGAPARPPELTDASIAALLGGEVTLRRADGIERTGVLVHSSDAGLRLVLAGGGQLTVPRVEVVELRVRALPPVTDADLSGALGDAVWVRLRNGSERTGELLQYTPNTITLVEDGSAAVSLPRGEVTGLGQRAQRRRFGFNVSLLPGAMIDVDAGLFRGYLSGSLVFPAALSGKMWGFSTGVGVGIPVSRHTPAFKIDVLAHGNLMGVASACSVCNYPTARVFGFGLAAGLHTTLDSGFTIGLTLPIIGYSVTPNYSGTENAAVGYYYLSSAVGMPLAFMGYRL